MSRRAVSARTGRGLRSIQPTGRLLRRIPARERVVLEFDSYGFHATRAAFERDRRKTSDLTRDRYLVLRTTWTELTKQPYALIARIAEAIALSAGAPTTSPARGGP